MNCKYALQTMRRFCSEFQHPFCAYHNTGYVAFATVFACRGIDATMPIPKVGPAPTPA